MRLLKDIAWEILKEGIPRPPAPIQRAIDAVREVRDDFQDGNASVRLVRDLVSARGVSDIQRSYVQSVNITRCGVSISRAVWRGYEDHKRSRRRKL